MLNKMFISTDFWYLKSEKKTESFEVSSFLLLLKRRNDLHRML